VNRICPRRQDLASIEKASLDELMARYPETWRAVGGELVERVKGGAPGIEAFVRQAAGRAAPWRARVARSRANPDVVASALPRIAAARMAELAAQRVLQSAAAGAAEGTVRFGLWTGWLVQRLLFARGLDRKPASLRAFRLLWPLAAQRRLLMPLVQPRGIWCFYTGELVRELAQLIRGRSALEIGAGDGTLARFLAEAGVAIRATDDQSWPRKGGYPEAVERLDAEAAVARYRPQVVLCSFPPPNNRFERRVLRAPSVELYVAIASRHRFAAGDWSAYEETAIYRGGVDDRLSEMVLPPEIDPAVVVLQRRERSANNV
jgi:hypothetical protein